MCQTAPSGRRTYDKHRIRTNGEGVRDLQRRGVAQVRGGVAVGLEERLL